MQLFLKVNKSAINSQALFIKWLYILYNNYVVKPINSFERRKSKSSMDWKRMKEDVEKKKKVKEKKIK